jgi:protein-S-isoprenylcysteine O-methyltransferase Ste14
MNIRSLISILWLLFYGYWLVSAIGIKRDVHREQPLWVSVGTRIVFIIAIFLLFKTSRFDHVLTANGALATSNSVLDYLGLALCVAGIAVAIWARRYLGKNWSATPSLKEAHELITTGPYRIVRHPIYTGILLALLGTALVGGAAWLVLFAVVTAIFVRRVFVEERLMMQRFPEQYPGYHTRTSALIPFVF